MVGSSGSFSDGGNCLWFKSDLSKSDLLDINWERNQALRNTPVRYDCVFSWLVLEEEQCKQWGDIFSRGFTAGFRQYIDPPVAWNQYVKKNKILEPL